MSSLSIYGGASDFTYYDSYTLNSDGSSDDSAFSQHYLSSTDGTIRIGYGIGPLPLAQRSDSSARVSGSGVYLNPAGVVNAASSAPFTAQMSPGEFLTLYGTGLADTTATASLPFPTVFNGVQVLINQVAAPIYYVSPTQISVVVPYGTDSEPGGADLCGQQRHAIRILSRTLRERLRWGLYQKPEGGLGYAAALHPDYSVIIGIEPGPNWRNGGTVSHRDGPGDPTGAGRSAGSEQSAQLHDVRLRLVFLLDAAGHYLRPR